MLPSIPQALIAWCFYQFSSLKKGGGRAKKLFNSLAQKKIKEILGFFFLGGKIDNLQKP